MSNCTFETPFKLQVALPEACRPFTIRPGTSAAWVTTTVEPGVRVGPAGKGRPEGTECLDPGDPGPETGWASSKDPLLRKSFSLYTTGKNALAQGGQGGPGPSQFSEH